MDGLIQLIHLRRQVQVYPQIQQEKDKQEIGGLLDRILIDGLYNSHTPHFAQVLGIFNSLLTFN